MARAFFPDPVFAWAFCIGLVLLTCVAAWTDTRTAKIPNRLNVLIFASGLLANAVRGGWLAAQDKPLWAFDTGAAWLGAIDGLLFALVGFIVTFAVMLAMWIFGLCGGGDVKLLAAVATWIGLTVNLLLLWFASVVVLFFWFTARILAQGLTPRKLNRTLDTLKKSQKGDETPGAAKRRDKLRVTYSLPIAVATAVVLLWMFRVELQLAPPKPQPQQGTTAHDRPTPVPA